MFEDSKEATIIFNFYIYQLEHLGKDRKESKEEKKKFSAFKPFQQNHMIQTFLGKKRKNVENKIIINDEPIKDDKPLSSLATEDSMDIAIEISNDENIIPSEKKILFQVNNKKKTGRKTKPTSVIKNVHTKLWTDNILRKIKVKFLNKVNKYINMIIKRKYRNIIGELKPLIGKISQNNSIEFNKVLLNTKLKDLYKSYEINGKFKLLDKNYNQAIIDEIYKQNIVELIGILEMTFLEIFNVFKGATKNEKLKELEKLDVVINEMKNKEQSKEYISKFKYIAEQFENCYFNKTARKQKKSAENN